MPDTVWVMGHTHSTVHVHCCHSVHSCIASGPGRGKNKKVFSLVFSFPRGLVPRLNSCLTDVAQKGAVDFSTPTYVRARAIYGFTLFHVSTLQQLCSAVYSSPHSFIEKDGREATARFAKAFFKALTMQTFHIIAVANWMPPPQQVNPGCPPGLEYLTQVDQLLVNQMIETFERRYHCYIS